ncbi:energy transducer TonB [Thalassobellus citreus]|uniref:energy transducer TonB n=1 Tax=Thalassobellus citreus TaxID=3367752 RepID=UPI0037AD9708
MKIVTVLFVFLLSISSFSQKKHPDGPYKEYHKNSQLRKVGAYKNDKKVGIWKHYFDNGNLHKRYLHDSKGKFTGIEEIYSKKGTLLSDTKQTETGSLITKKFYESGELFAEYDVVSAKRNNWFFKEGNYKEYYKNGVLKIESLYTKNELYGVWKQYYETGEKEWEVEYTEGYKQGVYKQFYKNKKLKTLGFHDLDLKSGIEKRYDSEGNETHSLKYKKGILKNAAKFSNITSVNIPDGTILRVPIFPGCNLPGNYLKRNCMSQKIGTFVSEKFNKSFAPDLGLAGKQRINVIFKIDKTGKVVGIRARANHRALEAEAIRVISLLPKMVPGSQYGKPVNVPYSMPIIFDLKIKEKKKNKYN